MEENQNQKININDKKFTWKSFLKWFLVSGVIGNLTLSIFIIIWSGNPIIEIFLNPTILAFSCLFGLIGVLSKFFHSKKEKTNNKKGIINLVQFFLLIIVIPFLAFLWFLYHQLSYLGGLKIGLLLQAIIPIVVFLFILRLMGYPFYLKKYKIVLIIIIFLFIGYNVVLGLTVKAVDVKNLKFLKCQSLCPIVEKTRILYPTKNEIDPSCNFYCFSKYFGYNLIEKLAVRKRGYDILNEESCGGKQNYKECIENVLKKYLNLVDLSNLKLDKYQQYELTIENFNCQKDYVETTVKLEKGVDDMKIQIRIDAEGGRAKVFEDLLSAPNIGERETYKLNFDSVIKEYGKLKIFKPTLITVRLITGKESGYTIYEEKSCIFKYYEPSVLEIIPDVNSEKCPYINSLIKDTKSESFKIDCISQITHREDENHQKSYPINIPYLSTKLSSWYNIENYKAGDFMALTVKLPNQSRVAVDIWDGYKFHNQFLLSADKNEIIRTILYPMPELNETTNVNFTIDSLRASNNYEIIELARLKIK